MPKPDQRRVLLGHISAANGLRGEVLIKTHTQSPEDIGAYGPLVNERGDRSFEISVVRVAKNGVICRLKGINDRTAAETLRGVELFIDRDRLPEPDAEDFYHADLIGLNAFAADGMRVGTVLAVQNFGAGDLLEIRFDAMEGGSGRTEFLPFTHACVPQVDVAAGRIVVSMPDGLLEVTAEGNKANDSET